MKKIWLLFFSIVSITCYGTSQDIDSANRSIRFNNRIGLRAGLSLYSGVEYEYSHMFSQYLSAEIIGSMYYNGIRGGISFYPISPLFIQGTIGSNGYREIVSDAVPFEPDYAVTVRGGLLLPLGKLPIAFEMSFGEIFLIENDYNPNGGWRLGDYVEEPHRRVVKKKPIAMIGLNFIF